MQNKKTVITHYSGQTAADFRSNIESRGVVITPEVSRPLLQPNGIYVSPETKNTFYQHSSGEIDGYKYEQFVTGYYQDLILTTESFAMVFAIELPEPTAPVYISSRTTLTLNSILGLQSVPVPKGLEKITMEGNFSEFFTVYSRDQHALDAFTTVVPNLMMNLLSNGNQFDIEFADRYVYFYRIYMPTTTTVNTNTKTSIKLSSNDYLEMREFGLKYGAKFIRAARPSQGHPNDTQPLWKIVNSNQIANNRQQLKWAVGIGLYVLAFVLFWFIVLPLTVIWVGFKYLLWHYRKRRLLTLWHQTKAD